MNATHTWTDRTGKVWQVWSDGRAWCGDAEIRLPRPVVDELLNRVQLEDDLARALTDLDGALDDDEATPARSLLNPRTPQG